MSPRTRRDGEPVPRLSALRRMMSYLIPTRNEAYVLFEQEIDSTPSRDFLAAFNSGRPAGATRRSSSSSCAASRACCTSSRA